MATAAYTTVVDRGVGDPLTEAIWDDQLKDNVNMLLGKASGNLLTNGGFEVWQRGTGSFTADGAYSADRWVLFKSGGSTITVTQETSTIAANSRYSLKAVTTSTTCGVQQKIENGYELRGQTVAVSIRVHQSVSSGVRVVLSADGGTTSGTASYSTTTGSFVTITTTMTLSATATYALLAIYFDLAGTYYLDNAMLVIGPNAAPYEPLHPQEELARCQRYYEVINTFNFLGSANGAHNIGQWVPWRVEKAGAPTVTKNGTWAVTNCGQPAVASGSVSGFVVYAAATGAGQVQFTTNGADDTVTGEINP